MITRTLKYNMEIMKRRNVLRNAWIAVLLSVGACSCDPAVLNEQPEPSAGGEDPGRVELPVRIGAGPEGTKASLLGGVESVGSGALVLVFRTASGQLDSYRYFKQEELDAQAEQPLRIQAPLTTCDFYILGNLNAVRKADGVALNLLDALEDAFPSSESELEALVYRLDGGELNASFRREHFSEVARYGIPYAHIRKGVDVVQQVEENGGIPGSGNCRRLFSKVTVRIDHAHLDGSGSRPQAFVNRKLYLRQANGRLQPFSDAGQKSLEAGDILSESDFDPDMAASNASVAVYSFYVPENLQGTLLPGNADSRRKTPEVLQASGQGAAVPFLTYVEFSGRLDPAQSGYGGDVTYRFYVGADNCTNFDLERGREYNISLSFRAGSLFSPDWSVGVEGWSDRRLFCLTADAAYQTRLPDHQQVVVRPNRPGTFYLYANPTGSLGASNALVGGTYVHPSVQESFSPVNITDYAFTGALFAPGSTEADWLAVRGITPEYDGQSGRLTLTVTNPGSFYAHLGEEAGFSLRLLPAGEWRYFTVCLADNIVASLSGSGDFYLGQKRMASVSGMTGTVWYRGDGAHWNTAPATGAVGGENHPYTGPIGVYGTYPGAASVTFVSSDPFNNDSQTLYFSVSQPLLRAAASSIWLPFDGTEQEVGVGYYAADGVTFMPPASFDADCWRNFLQPAIYSESKPQWSDCVGADYSSGQMYLAKTSNASGNIEDEDFRITGGPGSGLAKVREAGMSLGYVHVYNPALPALYPNNYLGCRISAKVTKIALGDIRVLKGWNGSTMNPDGTFSVGYYYEKVLWMGNEPHDQLTDDFVFGVTVPYAYPGADMGRIAWSRSGQAKTWRSSNGEQFGPVISYEVSEADTGSGGTVLWKYDESQQVNSASNGEPVPGGLLVPYGEQTVTASVTNKWDRRTYSVSTVFKVQYDVVSCSYFVTARNGSATARVYPLPCKVIKYLYRTGGSLSRAQRQEMIRLFDQGTGYWGTLQGEGLYRTDSYSAGYFLNSFYGSYPLGNFQASYLSKYLYGHQNTTVWSAGLMSALKTCPEQQIGTMRLMAITHAASVQNSFRNHEGVIYNGSEDYF